MKKIYITPTTSIINLYTAEEIAQQEQTGMLGYSRREGEFPDETEEDLSKEGSDYNGFFDAEDEDVVGGSNKPWWRR